MYVYAYKVFDNIPSRLFSYFVSYSFGFFLLRRDKESKLSCLVD
jgi:hypothetical protein